MKIDTRAETATFLTRQHLQQADALGRRAVRAVEGVLLGSLTHRAMAMAHRMPGRAER